MKPLTLEWPDKANGDLRTARREYRARKAPNFDAVCFHAQQTAEKCLKAMLQENGAEIPRIHSLADLLALVSKHDASCLFLQSDLNVVEGYAVQFRYPGQSADKTEAKVALTAAERVWEFTRSKFGL